MEDPPAPVRDKPNAASGPPRVQLSEDGNLFCRGPSLCWQTMPTPSGQNCSRVCHVHHRLFRCSSLPPYVLARFRLDAVRYNR